MNRAGGGLLLAAGAYIAYYGWYELRVLSGGSTGASLAVRDPIIGAATRIQGTLVRWLNTLGTASPPPSSSSPRP